LFHVLRVLSQVEKARDVSSNGESEEMDFGLFDSENMYSRVTDSIGGFRPDTKDLVSVLAKQRREIDRLNGLADRLEELVHKR
jgi:hypothetical protein